MRVLLAVTLFLGCGVPSVERPDSGTETPDSGSPPADAGTTGQPDAGNTPPTWADVQPIFFASCTRCHEGNLGIPPFAVTYSSVLQPSTLCPGQRVGDCIKAVLQLQALENGLGCRTYTTPFHREGWRCLSADDLARVVAWVDSGLREQ